MATNVRTVETERREEHSIDRLRTRLRRLVPAIGMSKVHDICGELLSNPDDTGRKSRRGFRRSDIAAAVTAFHSAFGLTLHSRPTISVPPDVAALRVRLLNEEVEEFAQASRALDPVAIADALADIVYVAYGSALTYGIDLDAVLAEVHRSNMTKLDANGQPILREDGKVLKSARYTPPDIPTILQQQKPLL